MFWRELCVKNYGITFRTIFQHSKSFKKISKFVECYKIDLTLRFHVENFHHAWKWLVIPLVPMMMIIITNLGTVNTKIQGPLVVVITIILNISTWNLFIELFWDEIVGWRGRNNDQALEWWWSNATTKLCDEIGGGGFMVLWRMNMATHLMVKIKKLQTWWMHWMMFFSHQNTYMFICSSPWWLFSILICFDGCFGMQINKHNLNPNTYLHLNGGHYYINKFFKWFKSINQHTSQLIGM